MDGEATFVMTYAAQPAAAVAHAGVPVHGGPGWIAEGSDAEEAAEAIPRSSERGERLRRLLLASRQMQQR